MMKLRRNAMEKLVADAMLASLSGKGFERVGDAALVSNKGGWREVLFVQLSSAPAQLICAVAGVDVPMARAYASGKSTESASIAVGGRLSERGINEGDMWLPAGTREDAEAAAGQLVSVFLQHESWFRRFRSVRDVADAYYRQSGLLPLGQNDYWKQVFLFNYACMLLAADQRTEAAEWLREAEQVIRSEKSADADDRARLQRVIALLTEIGAQPGTPVSG